MVMWRKKKSRCTGKMDGHLEELTRFCSRFSCAAQRATRITHTPNNPSGHCNPSLAVLSHGPIVLPPSTGRTVPHFSSLKAAVTTALPRPFLSNTIQQHS
jgi:hypothetical protein